MVAGINTETNLKQLNQKMFQFQGVGSVYIHYKEWCKSHLPLEAHANHQVTSDFVPSCNMEISLSMQYLLACSYLMNIPDCNPSASVKERVQQKWKQYQ